MRLVRNSTLSIDPNQEQKRRINSVNQLTFCLAWIAFVRTLILLSKHESATETLSEHEGCLSFKIGLYVIIILILYLIIF